MSKAEAVAALAVERRFPARVLLGEAGDCDCVICLGIRLPRQCWRFWVMMGI